MKKNFIVFSGIVLFLLNSCTQETNVQPMLQNAKIRNEVFKAITEDHELMAAFMGKMQESDHVIQMMKGDKKMMKMIMGAKGMQMTDKMENHQTIMKEMMNDGEMMGKMMKMMNEKGMMNEECMQSCMQMMADKGMDMDNMNENHELHNH